MSNLYPYTMDRHNSLVFYQTLLEESVVLTQTINDLLAMLRIIPLTHIKDFIRQEISQLDIQSCRQMYYVQTSIDVIFPSNIIQYILSFSGSYNTKAVSKQWEQHSEQNEQNHLTKLYSKYVHRDENVQKTYIIDVNRTKLHKMEIELGYKGPLIDIGHTSSICDSGDRILVPNGVHYSSEITINSNIQLLGVGAAVTIKPTCGFSIENGNCCSIKNIKLDCSEFWAPEEDEEVGVVVVKDNAALTLDNCAVTVNNGQCRVNIGEPCRNCHLGILAMNGSHLNIEKCVLIGCYAVKLSPFVKEVSFDKCIFKGCVIYVTDQYEASDAVTGEMMQLKCTNSIFDIDNNSFDDFNIIIYAGNAKQFITEKHILKDNELKGYICTYDQICMYDHTV